jgi:hypothetical protein
MSFDLDAIIGTKRTIKFLGKARDIKGLTTEEYLRSQAITEQIEDIPEGVDVIEHMTSKLVEYVTLILDVTEEEARQMDYRQFRALKEYMSELDLLDQGFTEAEIKRMKDKAAKNRVEQVIKDVGLQ